MYRKVALTAAASLAAIASPALAQDADREFQGPYIGATAGFDSLKAGSSIDDDGNPNNDQSAEGLAYGVVAGYDIDMGKTVIGVEGEYIDSTAESDFDDGDFEGFGLGDVKANRDLYVGVRAGVKATPRTLIYAKGGYTNQKFDIRSTDDGVDYGYDLDADGYRLGAGVEQKLGSNAFARVEYRYSNYGEAEVDRTGDIPDSERFDIDTDRHQVMGSVGWRF
jgi:outer membrane immunogenic protein